MMKRSVESELTKKCFNPFRSSISKKFVVKDSFKKDDIQQKEFDEDLSLLIIFKIFVNSIC